MKFSRQSAYSAVAAVTALFGTAQANEDCYENGPWKSHSVGYDTGGPFCATRWKQGGAINGVQAWYNGDSINGIEFQYTDGAAPERFGQMYGDKKDWLQWDTTKEEVEAITIWPNGRSDVERVAAIQITIRGREPWMAGNVPKKTQGYDSPVVNGAGIIMGAFGKHGGSIDFLGFMMLESGIKDRNIQDFNLNGDSLNANNEAIKNAKPEGIDSFTQENWTGNNMTYQVTRSTRKFKSWSTTRNSAKTFGGSVSAGIDFGLPAIGLGGSINTEFHWETKTETETNESGELEQSFEMTVSGKIPKGEAIYCESLAFSGKYDLDYGSTINLELQSGAQWSYHESGTVKGVAWSRNENKCVSYGPGETGSEVLQKKLEEWKQSPEKEEQDRLAREARAEEEEKPTTTSEAAASATDATPTETEVSTPTETEESTPTETEESTPTETEESTPTETEDPDVIEDDEDELVDEDTDVVDEDDDLVDEDTDVVDEDDTDLADEDTDVVDEDDTDLVDEDTDVVDDEDADVDEDTDVVDEDTDVTDEDADIVDEDTDVVDEDTDIVDEDTDVVDEDTDVVDEDTDVVDEDTDVVDEDTDVVDEDTDVVDEDTDIVDEDTDIVDEDTDVVDEDTDIVDEDTDVVDEEDADVVDEDDADIVDEDDSELVDEEDGEVADEEDGEVADEEDGEVVDEEDGEVVDEEDGEVVDEEDGEVVEEDGELADEGAANIDVITDGTEESSSAESSTVESATMGGSVHIGIPTPIAQPDPTTSSQARSTSKPRATATRKPIKNTRAEATHAPVIPGKRSMFFWG